MLGFLVSIGDRLARIPRWVGATLAILWAGFVWWLSSGPAPEAPLGWRFAYVFNLAHAPLFGMLALFGALALPRAERPNDRGARWPILTVGSQLLVLALVLAYAVTDEWHQGHTPERHATWRDIVTDVVGAASTLAVAAYLARADAAARGLTLRLAVGSAACAVAAWLATAA